MRTIFIRSTGLSLLTILALAPVLFPAKIFDKTAKKQLTAYLEEICHWILAREQGARDGQIQSIANTPLSIQGNLARVLLAGGELTKDGAKYLEEGLRLCDAFAERQERAVMLTSVKTVWEQSHWLVDSLTPMAIGRRPTARH